MISEDFATLLIATFKDPNENPVHFLSNQWWAHAPDEVKDAFVRQFLADPELAAFVDPTMITPLMDAITEGWQLGRRTPDIQCVKWETMLDQSLAELRDRFDMPSTADLSSFTNG